MAPVHVMLQLAASEQSTEDRQAPAPQFTSHGMPFGQMTAPVQLFVNAQSITQTPRRHEPMAQAASQAVAAASEPPASRGPTCPFPPAPVAPVPSPLSTLAPPAAEVPPVADWPPVDMDASTPPVPAPLVPCRPPVAPDASRPPVPDPPLPPPLSNGVPPLPFAL